MGPHRYAIDTHGVLTSARAGNVSIVARVCLIRARYAAKTLRSSERIAAGDLEESRTASEGFCNRPSRLSAQSRGLNGGRLVFTPAINVRTRCPRVRNIGGFLRASM